MAAPFGQTDQQAVLDSIYAAGLAPDSTSLFPARFKPTTGLSVVYGDKALALGNFFKKSECVDAPKISFQPESEDLASRTYTLLLVDPDAPYPHDQMYAFWRHWVVIGLKPSSASGDASPETFTQPALTEYLGPGPRDDSEPHRYIFQLFREPEGGLSLRKEDVGGEEFVQRRSFNSPEWAAKHGLELIAVNWMYCAADSWMAK